MHRSRIALFCGLVCVVALAAAEPVQSQEFFFKDGDVVVMIGDSITEQHLYSNYVEMWTVTPLSDVEADLPQRRHRRRHARPAATAASSATCCPTSRPR